MIEPDLRSIGQLTYDLEHLVATVEGGEMVSGRGGVQSPVLVGRDEFVSHARGRLDAAAAGNGGLLFVAGEAGIGKTRFLAAVVEEARPLGFSVVQAAAFPGDAETYGGILLDLAGDLRRSPHGGFDGAAKAISERLRDPAAGERDRNRLHRVLVQDLADALATLASAGPTMVVLEDLHWADQLSLDVLGRLGRHLPGLPVLVAGAYRSDELYPRRPMRDWRAALLTQRVADEVRLPRLTVGQTAAVAGAVLGHVPANAVVTAVHHRSDGIPLHVEEFIAAVDPAAWASASADPVDRVPVPDSLADAIMMRTRDLDPATREVVSAAAVIGRSFDFDLLVAASERVPTIVDRALRRLRDAHLVLPGSDTTSYDFRHALIRDALYADVGPVRRRRVHRQVATLAAGRGYPDSFVSAHFEAAGLGDLAYAHALAAARQASRVSAHSEAFGLFQRALRNCPAALEPAERASLQTAVADEAAAVDDNAAAFAAYQSAYDQLSNAGDNAAAAAVVPRLVAVAHLLGEDLGARTARIHAALGGLGDDPAHDPVRARLLAAMAAAYMLDRRLEDAMRYGEQCRVVCGRVGDPGTELDIATTLGSVLVFAGSMAEGWALLEDAVIRATRDRREAEAARAYRMIGSAASVLLDYDRARSWLTRGIEYAEHVELWNHRHYMASHLAHVQWSTGEWDAARHTAEQALADGRGGVTTRITAGYVLGYIALGRGEAEAANAHLTAALDEAEQMDELQRISPPLWGLAESALLGGDHRTAAALCERGYTASASVGDGAYLFPYVVTGVRAYLAGNDLPAAQAWLTRAESALVERGIPGTLATVDHARGLLLRAEGDTAGARDSLTRAAAAWRRLDRFWEGAWVMVDLASCAASARRRAEAVRLADEARLLAMRCDARPVIEAVHRVVESGAATSGPPWHPLTAREYQVARLVADGLTNPEIGERLGLSRKTVAAHVEHILTKLRAARRTEIAAWTATVDGRATPPTGGPVSFRPPRPGPGGGPA